MGGAASSAQRRRASEKEDAGHAPDSSDQFEPAPAPRLDAGGGNVEEPIRLGARNPTQKFTPHKSAPRAPGEPAYKRLLLISSRVHDCRRLAECALPDVATVVYDWKVFTLQELLRASKKVLGGAKVLTIGVAAPGTKPATVGLLEGCTTNAEKMELLFEEGDGASPPASSHPLMASTAELAQFWRALASMVVPSERGEGRRVDLLGCRMEEDADEGAALLKVLTQLASVPFASGDSVHDGYRLSTFCEERQTGYLSLRASPVRALVLYFDKYKLLKIPRPKEEEARQQASVLSPSGVRKDKAVFTHFTSKVKGQNLSLPRLFQKFDTRRTGVLSPEEAADLVRAVCPNLTPADIEHVTHMLDMDGDEGVSLVELQHALDQDSTIEQQVMEGQDEMGFMPALSAYFSNNEASFRKYFKDADVSGNGKLDSKEQSKLAKSIPGLEPRERKYFASFMHQLGGEEIDFDELSRAMRAFSSRQQAKFRDQVTAAGQQQIASTQALQQQQLMQQQMAQQQQLVMQQQLQQQLQPLAQQQQQQLMQQQQLQPLAQQQLMQQQQLQPLAQQQQQQQQQQQLQPLAQQQQQQQQLRPGNSLGGAPPAGHTRRPSANSMRLLQPIPETDQEQQAAQEAANLQQQLQLQQLQQLEPPRKGPFAPFQGLFTRKPSPPPAAQQQGSAPVSVQQGTPPASAPTPSAGPLAGLQSMFTRKPAPQREPAPAAAPVSSAMAPTPFQQSGVLTSMPAASSPPPPSAGPLAGLQSMFTRKQPSPQRQPDPASSPMAPPMPESQQGGELTNAPEPAPSLPASARSPLSGLSSMFTRKPSPQREPAPASSPMDPPMPDPQQGGVPTNAPEPGPSLPASARSPLSGLSSMFTRKPSPQREPAPASSPMASPMPHQQGGAFTNTPEPAPSSPAPARSPISGLTNMFKPSPPREPPHQADDPQPSEQQPAPSIAQLGGEKLRQGGDQLKQGLHGLFGRKQPHRGQEEGLQGQDGSQIPS